MKPKPWQIVLIVLGLTVGLGTLAYGLLSSTKVKVTSTIHCIDVETGELFRIDFPVVLPARHPTTKRISLVRVLNENGKWYVSPRDMGLLNAMDRDVKNQVVDEQSGDIRGEVKAEVVYPRPK